MPLHRASQLHIAIMLHSLFRPLFNPVDTRHQLLEADWFLEVVIGPLPECINGRL